MLQRPAVKTKVTIKNQAVDTAHVLTVDLSTGGGKLDTAIIEEFPLVEKKAERLIAHPWLGQECEISVALHGTAANAATSMQVIHWGVIGGHQISIAAGGAARRFVSRVEGFHFGKPLDGMRCFASQGSADAEEEVEEEAAEESDEQEGEEEDPRFITVEEQVVFNPEYDGRCVGNKSKSNDLKKTGFVPPEQLLFADQAGAVSGSERVRDTTAKTADGQEVEFWTLSQAVLMLCDQCNRDEEFIKNPDAKVLKDMMGADDRVLRAHRQPLGQYLNVQLDALLRPYGFDWCIDYLSPGKRQIRVFARGRGTGGRIKMQASGQDLDMDKTNAEDLDLTADVSSRCVNAFRVLGDYVQIEATWELVPAWDSTHDEADDEDLIDSSESWSLKDPENTSRVWRDWVLNEAGDYNDLRDGIEGTFDLAPFLGPCVNRRRKFEPTITLNTDGSPIGSCGGIEVEWWDSADAEWKKLTEIGAEGRQVNILSHECGIRFDGEVPPVELMDQGIDEETGLPVGKVRVTASIQADRRLVAFVQEDSPLDPATRVETLDVGSRFKKRFIHKSSIYKSKVIRKELRASQVDDLLAAMSFARQLLANWNQASVAGSITLTGCGYKANGALGRPILGVDGRGIDFQTTVDQGKPPSDDANPSDDASSGPAPTKRYPIVVGMKYDFTSQTTTAVLDTFRGETMG